MVLDFSEQADGTDVGRGGSRTTKVTLRKWLIPETWGCSALTPSLAKPSQARFQPQLTSPSFNTDEWEDYGSNRIVWSERLSHLPQITQEVESCLKSV